MRSMIPTASRHRGKVRPAHAIVQLRSRSRPQSPRRAHRRPTANSGSKEKPFGPLPMPPSLLKPGDTLHARPAFMPRGTSSPALKDRRKADVIMAAPDENPILDSSLVIARTAASGKRWCRRLRHKGRVEHRSVRLRRPGRPANVSLSIARRSENRQGQSQAAWFYDAKTRSSTFAPAQPRTGACTYHLSQHAYGFT